MSAIPAHLLEGYAPPHGTPLGTVDLGGGRHARTFMHGRELRHAHYVEGPSGALYDERAAPALIEAIEAQLALPPQARGEVRIFLGCRDTGEDFMVGHGARGVIARPLAAGPAPAPQRMARLACADGSGVVREIAGEDIVRLTLDGRQLYRHPLYHLPAVAGPTHDVGRPYGVFADGSLRALFTTEEQRATWLAFMEGVRPTPGSGADALANAAEALFKARKRVEGLEAVAEAAARHPLPPEPRALPSAPLAGGAAMTRNAGVKLVP